MALSTSPTPMTNFRCLSLVASHETTMRSFRSTCHNIAAICPLITQHSGIDIRIIFHSLPSLTYEHIRSSHCSPYQF